MKTREVSFLRSIGSGLCMGSADAVPGVSGGTIALVVGIYDDFINALSVMIKSPKLLTSKDGRAKIAKALKLLVPLGMGILAGYILIVKLLVGKEHAPGILLRYNSAHICFGFLFGLVLASIPEPMRRIKSISFPHWLMFAAAAAISAWFVGLPHMHSAPEKWMLLIGGAGAISVMLLPGISGSLLLVILGQYAAIGQAVTGRDWPILLTVAAGIAMGIITFVPLLRWLLSKAEAQTMAILAGLMTGSLRALWPFKQYYNPKEGMLANTLEIRDLHWVILAAVAGILTIFVLRRIDMRSH